MAPIEYCASGDYKRDLKKLVKKFRSLGQDIELVKKAAIELFHIHGIDNASVFPISGLNTPDIQIYKVKKVACMALKGKGVHSGIRIIYAYHHKTSTVVFIEIYYKGDKANENRARAEEYLKNN